MPTHLRVALQAPGQAHGQGGRGDARGGVGVAVHAWVISWCGNVNGVNGWNGCVCIPYPPPPHPPKRPSTHNTHNPRTDIPRGEAGVAVLNARHDGGLGEKGVRHQVGLQVHVPCLLGLGSDGGGLVLKRERVCVCLWSMWPVKVCGDASVECVYVGGLRRCVCVYIYTPCRHIIKHTHPSIHHHTTHPAAPAAGCCACPPRKWKSRRCQSRPPGR